MTGAQPQRILVIKLSAIGDVLMATPVAKALRTAFPDSYIAWIVERKSADVVTGNPFLDEVCVWDRHRGGSLPRRALAFLSGVRNLCGELRLRRFDVSIDLQGLIRSALVGLMSGARRRIGFGDGGEGSVLLYHDRYNPGGDEINAQQRNLDLLKAVGVSSTDTAMHMPVGDEDRQFATRFLRHEGLVGRKVVAFCPATTWENKHWTVAGWSGIADILSREYGATPLVLGAKADIPLALKIAEGSSCRLVISAGQTSLKQAGALMERCAAVIGVDTGLLHMAVALDRPAVGLFGASAWRCFLKKDNFVWVAKDFPCSPCRRHPTCRGVDCMQAITPHDVHAAVASWLE